MEERNKIIAVIVVIAIIFSISFYLLIPKPTTITALDGLTIADKYAKEWSEDAILYGCVDGDDNRINGTSDCWEFTYISLSTIRYDWPSVFGDQDMCEHFVVWIYANGTQFNTSYESWYPPYNNGTPIINWNFDTDQAFDYIIETYGIYDHLESITDELENTTYQFNIMVKSVNNLSYVNVQLNINYWNYSDDVFIWKFDANTGELIESNFNSI